MKVKFVQIDNLRPYLPFMKLSTFHKVKGDKVSFDFVDPDVVYISCIFSWNKYRVSRELKQYKKAKVVLGGYAISSETLPDKVEHIMPDYDLYRIDYSMGYTSRGCIRNCPWCIVPKKEGYIRDHAPLTEFLDERHEKVMLLDNNFQASPKWKENLTEIIDRDLKVCITQGLDIRLVTKEFAEMLSKCQYYDRKFKTPRLYFSFDTPEMEKVIKEKVKTLKNVGIKSSELMFYMLIGYNTSFEEDLHRFNVLVSLGVLPYPMLYNKRTDKPILSQFQRWVIRGYYRIFPFEEYSPNRVKKVEYEGLIDLDDFFGEVNG